MTPRFGRIMLSKSNSTGFISSINSVCTPSISTTDTFSKMFNSSVWFVTLFFSTEFNISIVSSLPILNSTSKDFPFKMFTFGLTLAFSYTENVYSSSIPAFSCTYSNIAEPSSLLSTNNWPSFLSSRFAPENSVIPVASFLTTLTLNLIGFWIMKSQGHAILNDN